MKRVHHVATLCLAIILVACGKSTRQSESSDTKDLSAHSIPTDLTESEEEFIKTITLAFSNHSPDLLVARICWDGIDDTLHDVVDDYIVDGVKRGVKTFEFRRVDPEVYTKRTEGDTTTVANLPVKWVLIVYHSSTGAMELSTEYLLGEKNGKILFTNPIAQ